MKVLVLDDDPIRHDAFSRALQGHEVVHAHGFQDAAEALRRHRFDLAYLDHDIHDFTGSGMYGGAQGGELTGEDVAKFIVRQDPEDRPRQVVVHSARPFGDTAIERMMSHLRDAGVPVEHHRYVGPESRGVQNP